MELTDEDFAPLAGSRQELSPADFVVLPKVLPPGAAGPAQQQYDYGDIAKSAATQGALGVAADIPGTIGSLGQLTDYVTSLPTRGAVWAADKMGLLPEGKTYGDFIKSSEKLGETMQTPAEKRGEVNYTLGAPFPTGKGMERLITENVPGMDYVPESPEGQAIGKAVRMGTSMVAPGPGGVPGAVGRFGAGVIGSAAGQQAAELNKETGFIDPKSGYAPYVEPLVGLLGTFGALSIGNGIKNLALPSKNAEAKVAAAINQDLTNGVISPKELNERIAQGMSLADSFPDKSAVRTLLGKEAGLAGPEAQGALEQYNASVRPVAGTGSPRIPEAQRTVLRSLQDVNGGPIDMGAVALATKDANSTARNALYGALKSTPEARAIPITQIGQDLVDNPLVSESMAKIAKDAPGMPKAWNVVTPSTVGPPRAGNLAYWDLVKRDLDRKIAIAENRNSPYYDTITAQSLMDARKALVGRLDSTVPTYASTRAKAGELFGQDSAPAAGREFYTRMDPVDRTEAIQAFGKMPAETQQLFRTGWMSQLGDEVAKPNGLRSVANKFARDQAFQDNARLVLGPKYDVVNGTILAENLRTAAKEIRAEAPKGAIGQIVRTGGKWAAFPAAMTALGTDALTTAAIQSQFTAPDKLALILGGVAAGVAKSGAQQFSAVRTANRVVPLILSTDKADMVRLSRLAQRDDKVRKMLSTMNEAFQILQDKTVQRPERATGGRINRTGKADELIRMVEQHRKEIGAHTETLLKTPDNAIARALEIANSHI